MPDVPSYRAEIRTTPPRTNTFSAKGDPAEVLASARRWVEDQARTFLGERSLPKNPWDAGAIYPGDDKVPVASLAVYTSDEELVFDWDDQD
jgi:hypothetical protein